MGFKDDLKKLGIELKDEYTNVSGVFETYSDFFGDLILNIDSRDDLDVIGVAVSEHGKYYIVVSTVEDKEGFYDVLEAISIEIEEDIPEAILDKLEVVDYEEFVEISSGMDGWFTVIDKADSIEYGLRVYR